MFTTACLVITKGKEEINYLTEIGYLIQNPYNIEVDNYSFYILTVPEEEIPKAMILPLSTCHTLLDDAFNCGENKKAFLAIAEMRDDSDKNQYFVNEQGDSWVNLGMWIEAGSLTKCLVDDFYHYYNGELIFNKNREKYHRASAEEIFNWFSRMA